MGISSDLRGDGIRVVTMDHPPVNALTVQGWYDVAAALDEASRDLDTHVVVLRAEGRGFNAGVDIKEMQNSTGFDALIGANKGCFAAFKADAQSKADSVAREIRDKAGTRYLGICTSTIPEDVTRFGPACATLKQIRSPL